MTKLVPRTPRHRSLIIGDVGGQASMVPVLKSVTAARVMA